MKNTTPCLIDEISLMEILTIEIPTIVLSKIVVLCTSNEKNYKPHQIRGSRMQQQKTKVLNESCPLAEWEGHEANFGAKSWPQKMTN